MTRWFVQIWMLTTLWVCLQNGLLAQNLPDSIQQKMDVLSVEEQIQYLGDLCWQYRESNSSLSLELGQLALQKAYKLKNENQIARISNFLGAIHLHYFFDSSKAIPLFHDALKYGLQLKNSTEIGYAYNNLGDAFYLNGNENLALEYGEKSLEIFEEIDDPSGIAYSHVNLGLAYSLGKSYDQAIGSFQKAVEYGEQSQDKNRIAYAYLEIGNMLYAQKKYDEAYSYYEQSLELHTDIENLIYGAYCITGMASVKLEKGKLEEADSLYHQSLRMAEIRKHSFAKIDNLLGLALVCGYQGKSDEGARFLQKANEITAQVGVPSKLKKCYEWSARFYQITGDFEEATRSFSRFMFVSDSIYHQDQADILKETRDRFEAEQAAYEFQQKLKASKTQEIYLISVVSLMLILVLIIIWRYRTSSRLNKELQKINESKDKLFSIISHDLRNPFIALIQYAELLQDGDLNEEQRAVFTKDLDQRTKSTYNLLENLLNLSASKTGKIGFNPKTLSLKTLLPEIHNLLRPLMDSKKIHLELEIQSDQLFGDENMIRVILRNILINAIKYSYPEGKITLTSIKGSDSTMITISDTGTGMDPVTLKALFSADFLSSARGTSGEKGTGIGLSLCKEFMDRHQGDIQIQSSPGKGSRFTLTFPDN